ncbi:MAG: TAXI family TRAP transporter solute-binding subunit [Burkholderiales bacterium]
MTRQIRHIGALALAALIATPAVAQDIKLPPTLTFTAYDTGSSGFNMAVAIGKAMKDKHGTDVRVLPAGNDVARLAPLKAGRAQASAMGIGVYFAQEGVFEFAVREWGPQPLRLMLASSSCNSISLGVAKDTGVKEIKDLKGKRIGMVVGSPALNQNALAVIAFGNLTRNDVRLVEFSSYGAMWKGMMNNEVDAAIASNISGQAKEMEASPRGLMFPQTPHADKAGWARLNKVAPFYIPQKSTCGVDASKERPAEMPNYPYPIFVSYAAQPADVIHGATKSMIVNYALYKDGAPGADGFELARQNLAWVLPLHDGAVRAIREAGAWKPELDAHQQAMVRRQAVLGEAWATYMKTSPPEAPEAFRRGWMDARAGALKKAGMDTVFD